MPSNIVHLQAMFLSEQNIRRTIFWSMLSTKGKGYRRNIENWYLNLSFVSINPEVGWSEEAGLDLQFAKRFWNGMVQASVFWNIRAAAVFSELFFHLNIHFISDMLYSFLENAKATERSIFYEKCLQQFCLLCCCAASLARHLQRVQTNQHRKR